MKIKVTTAMLDIEGATIPLNNDDTDLKTTLRTIVLGALLATLRGDENLIGEKKAQLFALALRVRAEDECDMKAEEITIIKERIGRAYPVLIVGRAYEILDPSPKKD